MDDFFVAVRPCIVNQLDIERRQENEYTDHRLRQYYYLLLGVRTIQHAE